MTHHLPALITVLAVLVQVAAMINVGRARAKYKIDAPATTGHPDFERACRIQGNTVESTLMFLPVLWVFAGYVSELWAGVIGLVWVVGRVIYIVGYQRAATKRGPGFIIGALSILVLLLGGLAGVVRAMLLT